MTKKRRPTTDYEIEWLDWDFNPHHTKYSHPKYTELPHFGDKKQIRASVRGKCRQILQRRRL